MMSDDLAPPIEKLLKAFDAGIRLAKRVSRSAREASPTKALQIAEAGHRLQRSLGKDVTAIIDEYLQSLEACGQPFFNALVEDQAIQSKLQDLRVELLDQIAECPEFDEVPNQFDPRAFTGIQQHSEKCCSKSVSTLKELRSQILLAASRNYASDRQAQLGSKASEENISVQPPESPILHTSASRTFPPSRSADVRRTSPQRRPVVNTQVQPAQAQLTTSVMPKIPWSVASPSVSEMSLLISPPRGGSPSTSSRGTVSPITPAEGQQPPFAGKEVLTTRTESQEDILRRHRRSRTIFQDVMRLSLSLNEEEQAGNSLSMNSPTLGMSPTGSPVEKQVVPLTSSSGYDALVSRERSLGQASQASHGTISSRASSLIQSRPRHNSQESIFGLRSKAPASPPLSERNSSSTENYGRLASTLQVADFGQGVESGLEVANLVDRDNLPMLLDEIEVKQPTLSREPPESTLEPTPEATPAASVISIEYPLRHDTSFYNFGGFCDGAKANLRGETGFKVVKKAQGKEATIVSARCVKCAFEVPWDEVEKDRTLDRDGIHIDNGIRWRQQFISKCHVKSSSSDQPIYACVFCVEDHKTVEEHDATVFFSISQLFRHLAKHPTPVAAVSGITTLYHYQPVSMLDFDIHFTNPEPQLSQYSMAALGSKAINLPSAHAITTHRPKPNSKSFRDPEGNPTLHFGDGAKIIGITFPEYFNGQYCIGYHDGDMGSFPSNSITLELPAKEEVIINAEITLVAIAKWDFKPKDVAKDGGGWLRFSKGDRINNVGYSFLDQWCWSGRNSKGKWGFFPAAFVESSQSGAMGGGCAPSIRPTSPGGGSVRSSAFSTLGSRMKTFPLSRAKSRKVEKEEPVRGTTSSGFLGGKPLRTPAPIAAQARLEVSSMPPPTMSSAPSLGGNSPISPAVSSIGNPFSPALSATGFSSAGNQPVSPAASSGTGSGSGGSGGSIKEARSLWERSHRYA